MRSRIKRTALVAGLLLVLLGVFTIPILAHGPSTPPEPQGFWTTHTAYKVDWAFTDPPWESHYGAFFNGSLCYNQHYLGPGGDPATCGYGPGGSCIDGWNWWGPDHAVLLCPKC